MIRWLVLTSMVAVSGCATTPSEPTEHPAALTTLDSPMRDRIRIYVRDLIGPDYYVDLESLTGAGYAKATDRRRGDPYRKGYIPKPTMDFALFLVGEGEARQCELRPQNMDGPPLIFPAASCYEMDVDEIVVVPG